MNAKGLKFVFLLTALLMAASLACGGSVDVPPKVTPIQPSNNSGSQNQPTAEPQSTDEPQPTEAPSSGGLVVFTDKSNLYQIQLPSDWAHTESTGQNYYIDTFKSPDEKALVENIVYDDDTTFNGGQKGKFALELIYRFYSATGSNKDITITGDQLQDDGSERLTWYSESGGYTGASYFETRTGRTTFLMFTIEWMDDYKDLYFDTLNNVVESYSIP